jgi:antitoxin Phd
MDIRIDSLIPFDSLKTNIDHVFSVVDKNGKAVLLKDNKPVYIVLKYDENHLSDAGIGMKKCLTIHFMKP